MMQTETILSQLPGNALAGLRRTDELWRGLRENTLPVPNVVQECSDHLATIAWDVVICGGTLGILVGTALVQRGWRVALLERGTLRGRQQEWNISRHELQVLVELGLLTAAELDQAIATEYNPARISFLGGSDLWVRDVLNIGVDPVYLLETLKQRFLTQGGQLFEQMAFTGAIVHPNGVEIQTEQQSFPTRLLLDAMGHFSPIVRQSRQGKRPDAVCLVVGTCATGFPHNDTGDLLVSFTPIQNQCQYFWEAFPARDGRTTYLFTYLDAHPDRLSLEALFDEYFRLLPDYQQVTLEQLNFQRALFGCFPCYRQSPLKPQWHRILAIGDSSGSQSPLSFGGFGAMIRHLQRLTDGIHEALQTDSLDRSALALLQPYQPNLAVTWLFQRAMSVGIHQTIPPNQINQLLSSVFEQMAALGEPVLKPFLQDVVQFPALFQTLIRTSIAYPQLVLQILPQVGWMTILDWLVHYINLANYTALFAIAHTLESSAKNLAPVPQYYYHRWLQAFQYGAGKDYSD
ncbi:FAD-dependent oxidoreductase [Pantanalinema rosaneae CENA516]|uniref:FAD-dependent oxidoreductase n=1 Tax=Pantanalinema rosaneae TaxID=1620701 RepID=UPI003D6F6154